MFQSPGQYMEFSPVASFLNSTWVYFSLGANKTGGGVRPLRVHLPEFKYEGCENVPRVLVHAY